jgi:hypothetical protein
MLAYLNDLKIQKKIKVNKKIKFSLNIFKI